MAMRLSITLMLLCVNFQQQVCYITYLSGEAKLTRTGKLVHPGEQLVAGDILQAEKAGTRVFCVAPDRGRFELSATGQPAKQGELIAFVKTNMMPQSKHYRLSTRAGGAAGVDPLSYFSAPETDGRVLILENEPIKISATMQVDANNFLFFQYIYGGKPVTERIYQKGNELYIGSADFQTIPKDLTIGYQRADKTVTKIADFRPVFVKKHELLQLISSVAEHSGITDRSKLLDDISQHIYEVFGKFPVEEIDKLLPLKL